MTESSPLHSETWFRGSLDLHGLTYTVKWQSDCSNAWIILNYAMFRPCHEHMIRCGRGLLGLRCATPRGFSDTLAQTTSNRKCLAVRLQGQQECQNGDRNGTNGYKWAKKILATLSAEMCPLKHLFLWGSILLRNIRINIPQSNAPFKHDQTWMKSG